MSSTSTDPRVPIELQFSIIDWVDILEEDANLKLLRVCASVSRSWHQMVSKHAFRRAIFHNPGDTERFKDLVKGNPYITTAVTQICICEPDSDFDAPPVIPWALDTLAEFSVVLANVTSIVLMGFHFLGDFYDSHSFESSISYPRCTRLEFLGCILPVPVFRLFLSNFPTLRDLVLYGLVHPESISCDLSQLPGSPIPPLSRIRFRAVGRYQRAFPMLVSSNAVHNLHELSISIWSSDDPKGVDSFLLSLESSLTNLELKFVDDEEGFDYGDIGQYESLATRIRNLPKLQTLTIRPGFHPIVKLFVSCVTSPSLLCLRLTVAGSDTHEIAESLCKTKPASSFQQLCLIYKGPKINLDNEKQEMDEIFLKLNPEFRITSLHSADLERWWTCLHDL